MTDLAKCYGTLRSFGTDEPPEKCPLRVKCWRYLAPHGEFRQTYIPSRYDRKEGKCLNYLDPDLTEDVDLDDESEESE